MKLFDYAYFIGMKGNLIPVGDHMETKKHDRARLFLTYPTLFWPKLTLKNHENCLKNRQNHLILISLTWIASWLKSDKHNWMRSQLFKRPIVLAGMKCLISDISDKQVETTDLRLDGPAPRWVQVLEAINATPGVWSRFQELATCSVGLSKRNSYPCVHDLLSPCKKDNYRIWLRAYISRIKMPS